MPLLSITIFHRSLVSIRFRFWFLLVFLPETAAPDRTIQFAFFELYPHTGTLWWDEKKADAIACIGYARQGPATTGSIENVGNSNPHTATFTGILIFNDNTFVLAVICLVFVHTSKAGVFENS